MIVLLLYGVFGIFVLPELECRWAEQLLYSGHFKGEVLVTA